MGDETGEAVDPVVQVDAPQDDGPKDDAPQDDALKDDAPKDDAPKDDAPKDDAPKDDAPKDDASKDDAPKDDAPKDDAPPAEGGALGLPEGGPLVKSSMSEGQSDGDCLSRENSKETGSKRESFTRRKVSLSSMAYAKDQEILAEVKAKLRRREALQKRRETEMAELQKTVADIRSDLNVVNLELEDEQRPQERLGLLERKKACVEKLEEAEEAEAKASAAFDQEEAELAFTADEERMHRGMRAESMHRMSVKKEAEKENKALTRRVSARDMQKLAQEREEEEGKRLESAKVKTQQLAETTEKQAKLREQQRQELERIDAGIAENTRRRSGLDGEEFLECSQRLIELHEERDKMVDRHEKERAEMDAEIAQHDLTGEEEAAMRGREAREKQRKVKKDLTNTKGSPRAKHAQYSHRGAENIRRVDLERRVAANKNVRELRQAAEEVGRQGVRISEVSDLIVLTRSVAKELMTDKDAPAEQRFVLAQNLRSAEDQASEELPLLRAEKSRLEQERLQLDKHTDRSMERARTTSPPCSSFPSPAGSPGRRVAGASERLLNPPRRRELPALDRGPKLSKTSQELVNQRLHDASLQRARQREERLRAEEKPWVTTKPLRPDEEDFLVQRMFYQQREREKALASQLTSKWKDSRETRKLQAEEEKESNSRMFYNRRGHRDEVRAMLTEKYISRTDPVFPRLGRTAIEAAVLRLSTPSPS